MRYRSLVHRVRSANQIPRRSVDVPMSLEVSPQISRNGVGLTGRYSSISLAALGLGGGGSRNVSSPFSLNLAAGETRSRSLVSARAWYGPALVSRSSRSKALEDFTTWR